MRWVTVGLALLGVWMSWVALYRVSKEASIRVCDANALERRVEELAIRIKIGEFTDAEYQAFLEDLHGASLSCIRQAYE